VKVSTNELRHAMKTPSTSILVGGFCVYYRKDNKRIREDAEGKKFKIRYDSAGKRQEFEYHE